MKKILMMALAVCLVLGVSGRAGAQAGVGKTHRVVFAITSGDEADWQMTVGNITHMIEGFKPDAVEVEVVAYSKGLSMVKIGSSVAADIATLEALGVKFVACQNAMRMQHVEPKDLLAGVGMVPAGIVEVVKKQEQGWSYIKAGR